LISITIKFRNNLFHCTGDNYESYILSVEVYIRMLILMWRTD